MYRETSTDTTAQHTRFFCGAKHMRDTIEYTPHTEELQVYSYFTFYFTIQDSTIQIPSPSLSIFFFPLYNPLMLNVDAYFFLYEQIENMIVYIQSNMIWLI